MNILDDRKDDTCYMIAACQFLKKQLFYTQNFQPEEFIFCKCSVSTLYFAACNFTENQIRNRCFFGNFVCNRFSELILIVLPHLFKTSETIEIPNT